MSTMTGPNGRGRNRNNTGKRPQGRSGNFDPNGGRNRGNAQQLMDKFMSLARDATQQGDRVAAENYFQHADHYYRIVNARNEQQNPRNEQQNNPRNEQQNPRNEQQNASNDKPDSNRRPQNFDNSGSTTDPIPVQPPQPDRGPANLVASPVPSVPQAPVQTIPIQQPSEAITPVPTQAANPTEQLVAELEAQAPKKPRRGRPPKKSAENEDDAPAPEAAE